jgi:hypothetical protein
METLALAGLQLTQQVLLPSTTAFIAVSLKSAGNQNRNLL